MTDKKEIITIATVAVIAAIFGAVIFFLSSCVSKSSIPDPASFVSLPSEYTPEHNFRVSTYNVGLTDTLLQDIDLAFDWFSVCMLTNYQTALDPTDFEKWRIVVVPTQFKCYEGEHSWCGGYYVSEFNMIILAYSTPTGTLDYADHEWRDVCVYLNLCPQVVQEDRPNQCTKYKHIGD